MNQAWSSFCSDKVTTLMALSPHRSFVLSSKTQFMPSWACNHSFVSPTLELQNLANKTGCPVRLEFQTNNKCFFSMSQATLPCPDSVGSFRDTCHWALGSNEVHSWVPWRKTVVLIGAFLPPLLKLTSLLSLSDLRSQLAQGFLWESVEQSCLGSSFLFFMNYTLAPPSSQLSMF